MVIIYERPLVSASASRHPYDGNRYSVVPGAMKPSTRGKRLDSSFIIKVELTQWSHATQPGDGRVGRRVMNTRVLTLTTCAVVPSGRVMMGLLGSRLRMDTEPSGFVMECSTAGAYCIFWTKPSIQ